MVFPSEIKRHISKIVELHNCNWIESLIIMGSIPKDQFIVRQIWRMSIVVYIQRICLMFAEAKVHPNQVSDNYVW